MDVVNDDLRIVPPRAGRQEIVVVEKLHVHDTVVVDPFDDVDAFQRVIVPDVDGGLVAVLPARNQIGRRHSQTQNLALRIKRDQNDSPRAPNSASARSASGSKSPQSSRCSRRSFQSRTSRAGP